jgi:hypothetical protein
MLPDDDQVLAAPAEDRMHSAGSNGWDNRIHSMHHQSRSAGHCNRVEETCDVEHHDLVLSAWGSARVEQRLAAAVDGEPAETAVDGSR